MLYSIISTAQANGLDAEKREKTIADATKEHDKDRAEYNKLYIMFLSDKYKLSGKDLFSAIFLWNFWWQKALNISFIALPNQPRLTIINEIV